VLSEHLRDAAREGTAVDIAQVVDSDWKRLIFICPYEEAEDVRRRLGFEWPEYERRDQEGEVHWVFADEDEVRTWAVLPRGLGDPCYAKPPAERPPDTLQREASRFIVRDTGQQTADGDTYYILQMPD
jgi:hypothetical protein